jgi:hypothetical protein
MAGIFVAFCEITGSSPPLAQFCCYSILTEASQSAFRLPDHQISRSPDEYPSPAIPRSKGLSGKNPKSSKLGF